MKKRIYSFLLLSLLAFPAVLQAQPASSDAVEKAGPGTVNWTTGMLTAKGSGAPRPDLPPAQSRLMAERAAKAQAYVNLLEAFKGIQIDSSSVVENFVTQSDVIKTRVQGIIRGAMLVGLRYMPDGACEVTMTMPIQGALLDVIIPPTFGNAASSSVPAAQPRPGQYSAEPPARPSVPPAIVNVEPAKPEPLKYAPMPVPQPPAGPRPSMPATKIEPAQPAPMPTPAQPHQAEKKSEPLSAVKEIDQSTMQFKGGKATGIVIDVRGLGLRPALLPKILDPQGKEVYVGQVVTRTNAVEQGVAGYAKDVSAAANNFRVTDNPAVIKALSTAGTAKTDIVIAQADAQALRRLSSTGDFLQYCRVIIVY